MPKPDETPVEPSGPNPYLDPDYNGPQDDDEAAA